MASGTSRKAAILPRDSEASSRTSEPSGAIASGGSAIFLVTKVGSMLTAVDRSLRLKNGASIRTLHALTAAAAALIC
jgi:hypothetical protein